MRYDAEHMQHSHQTAAAEVHCWRIAYLLAAAADCSAACGRNLDNIRPPPSVCRTHDIQRLSRALKAKQQQLSNLEADHHQLSHRHYLLASSCDLLQLLATLKQSANRTQSLDKLHQPTATAESEALQQLRRLQYQQNPPVSHTDRDTSCDIPSGSSSYSSNSSNCHPFSLLQLEEAETLGTFEDPLRALRSQLLHEDIDPYPGIQELTVEQMQADYRSMIHQLALNVGFLDNPISRSRDDDNNP